MEWFKGYTISGFYKTKILLNTLTQDGYVNVYKGHLCPQIKESLKIQLKDELEHYVVIGKVQKKDRLNLKIFYIQI